MGKLMVKNKEIVVPGQELAEGLDYLPSFGTYRDENNIIASKLGIANIDGRTIKITPLSGVYSPQRGDTIIGKVFDVSFSGWRLETNCAYAAMLSVKDATSDFIQRGADLTRFFNIGDYLVAKITNVTSQKLIDLTMKGPGLRKLSGGRIVKVNTHKVPRIIGKQGSMVSLIKEATGCRITVGQNGLIWIDGEPKNEFIAVSAIRKIEKESYMPGLTEKIKKFLEEQTQRLGSLKPKPAEKTKKEAEKPTGLGGRK